MKRVMTLLLALELISACQLDFSPIGTWSVETPPPVQITTNAVVALTDGRVALFGGFNQQTGQALAQTLLFDPQRDVWATGAPMPGPPGPDVVVLLHDGTVLVEGGQTAAGLSGETWLYDPRRNAWRRASSLQTARSQPSFAVLTDGRVLVAGGSVLLAQPVQLANGGTVNYQAIDSAEIFDPGTKTWSSAGRLSSARSFVSLVALPHGTALAAGGCAGGLDSVAAAVSVAELFDPASGWIPSTSLPEPRCGASGLTLQDGRAFLVGGSSDTGSLPGALAFDPQSHRWTPFGTVGGAGSSPILLADGRVLLPDVQTGPVQGRVLTAFVGGQIFDPASGDWKNVTTTSLPLPSIYLQQGGTSLPVALANGDALVLLQTVALAFHATVAPPAGQLLDSTGLTFLLLGLAAVLGLLLAGGYFLGRKSLA